MNNKKLLDKVLLVFSFMLITNSLALATTTCTHTVDRSSGTAITFIR